MWSRWATRSRSSGFAETRKIDRDGGGDVPQAAGPGPGGGQHRLPAAGDREDRRGARAGAGQAGLDHAAPEVQGHGRRADEGRGRAAHAVLHGLPAAVLLPDDGRDGGREAAGGRGDGDAGGQREPGDRPDLGRGHGEGAAVRHPRGRTDGRRRHRHGDPRVGWTNTQGVHEPSMWPRLKYIKESGHGKNQNPPQVVRPPAAGPVGQGHRGQGQADGRPHLGPHPAADPHPPLLRPALAARRQEVARALRDARPQAADRHQRVQQRDDRGAPEAGPPGRDRRRDPGLRHRRSKPWSTD